MTTLPIEDEKDTRLIAEMGFAMDTTPEEKAALRRLTALTMQVAEIAKEVARIRSGAAAEFAAGKVATPEPSEGEKTYINALNEKIEGLQPELRTKRQELDRLTAEAETVRAATADKVRGILRAAGLTTAQDVIDTGCTGLAARGVSIEDAKFVRENMGGARISLPCYVGLDRYCLVHETIGGLQQGQKQLHPEYVSLVSRDLTPKEKGHVALVESVLRHDGTSREAQRILRGHVEPPFAERLAAIRSEPSLFEKQLAAAGVKPPPAGVSMDLKIPLWTCPEHGEIFWGCRYCIAQALVAGTLEPEILLQPTIATIEGPGAPFETVVAASVAARLVELDARGAHEVKVFVRAATFRRKFVMD